MASGAFHVDARTAGTASIGARGLDLTRHADISIRFLKGAFRNFYFLWKILTKDERYNAVILRKGFIFRVLKMLGPLCPARILSLEDKNKIMFSGTETFDLCDPGKFTVFLRKA